MAADGVVDLGLGQGPHRSKSVWSYVFKLRGEISLAQVERYAVLRHVILDPSTRAGSIGTSWGSAPARGGSARPWLRGLVWIATAVTVIGPLAAFAMTIGGDESAPVVMSDLTASLMLIAVVQLLSGLALAVMVADWFVHSRVFSAMWVGVAVGGLVFLLVTWWFLSLISVQREEGQGWVAVTAAAVALYAAAIAVLLLGTRRPWFAPDVSDAIWRGAGSLRDDQWRALLSGLDAKERAFLRTERNGAYDRLSGNDRVPEHAARTAKQRELGAV